jgi:hypothetical protein
MGLLRLPPELLEDVLVLLARSDCPRAIAHLAGTCKSMNKLIYSAVDTHLWRRIFLTTFDDPRLISSGAYFFEYTLYKFTIRNSD